MFSRAVLLNALSRTVFFNLYGIRIDLKYINFYSLDLVCMNDNYLQLYKNVWKFFEISSDWLYIYIYIKHTIR